MNIKEIAAKVDPAKAQLAIARAMSVLGSEMEWDSETIEHVCNVLSPAFPHGLPSAFDQDDTAVEFWRGVTF